MISKIIKKFRIDELKLSQEELAEELGIDQAKVSRLESGKYSLHNIINWYVTHGIADFIVRLENGEKNITDSESSESRH